MTFVLTGQPAEPLDRARILYRNALRAGGSTNASSTADGYSPAAVRNSQTFDRWRPVGNSGSVTANFSSRSVTHVGVLVSSVNSLSVNCGGSVGSASGSLTGAYFFEFPERTASSVSVQVSGPGPEIACIFVGRALIMQRPIYGGHSPLTLSRQTTRNQNLSESGEYLGSSIRRLAMQATYDWQHLEADWYRDNMDDFADYLSNGDGTFFMAWRPAADADDVGYGWSQGGDLIPSNMGVRDLMSVSLSMRAYAGRPDASRVFA